MRSLTVVQWWQTLLIAVLTPAVTAVALLWQNRVNNKREDRRRAGDADERERERRYAVRDHWREERKEAHAALLADFQSARDELHRQVNQSGHDAPGAGLDSKFVQEAQEHLAAVQMLSLNVTREAAEAAFDAFTGADGGAFAYRILLGKRLTEEDRERRMEARRALIKLRTEHVAYLDAVRKELGTESDE